MRNVTITLEEETARWARVKAASQMKSLSRFVSELLEAQKRAEAGEKSALDGFLEAVPAQPLGIRRFERDELHDRQVLRR